MHPRGIIYKSGQALHGSVHVAATVTQKIGYGVIRGAAAAVGTVGVLFLILLFGPLLKTELNYDLNGASEEYLRALTAQAETTAQVQTEAAGFGVSSYFAIVIPKIGASSNIVANVDPFNKAEYMEALSTGVAHAKGTYFPGQGKQIYLFSHSTDMPLSSVNFNATFYLLRKLELGDRVVVYFGDKKYLYEVTEKAVVGADELGYLTNEVSTETLILQTCDPPGTTLKRLIVTAKRIS